jgi:hypothetical protein
MKPKFILAIFVVVFFIIPTNAPASTVFETTGWIIGTQGFNYEFVADQTPLTYIVTLSDLSESPFFGFSFLYLNITLGGTTVDSIVGPGIFEFTAVPNETYFANIIGTGAGTAGAGLFGIEITAVPIPTSLMLLGSGLLGLIYVRRRKR